jgi:transcriptional regulator with XRE-family HTH domain
MSSTFSSFLKTATTIVAVEKENDRFIGKRIAELRKQRGYTQKELAEKMGIPWTLISDYERAKLRLHDRVITKFATALEVSADEILGLVAPPRWEAKPSLRIVRRLKRIETLPASKQKALLQIIDGFLKGENR